MREKIVKLYTYDELGEAAQAKAREWFAEIIASEFEPDYVCDDAATLAEFMGLDIRQREAQLMNGSRVWKPSIYYALHTQGAGACFDGTWRADKVQPGKAIEHAPQDAEIARIAAVFERIATLRPDACLSVRHSGHYYHEQSTSFDVDTNPPEDSDEQARPMSEWKAIEQREETLAEELREACRDFMRWIYKRIDSEYDYQLSAEQLAEGIRANEYEFTEDGKRED